MSESEHDYDIKFLPEPMIAALGMALGARDQKSKLPVIRAVHIYTKGGRLWVASTNLEHFYRAPIGCKVDTDLDCVVDYPDGLQAMLRLYVNAKLSFPVEMKLNKRTMLLTVRIHKTVATFKCTDPQEYPIFPAYVEDEDKTEPKFYKGPAGSASYGYALPPTFKNALAQPPHPGKKMTDLQRQNAIVALACEREDDFDMDALVDGLDAGYNWPRCLMDWRYRDADKHGPYLNGEPYEVWDWHTLQEMYRDEPVQGCEPDPAIWGSVILTRTPDQACVRPFVSYYRIDGTGWQPEPEPPPAPAPGIVVGTKRASHKASKKAFLNSFGKLARATVKPTPAKGKVFQNAVAALPEADYNEVLDAIDNEIEATDQAIRSTIERLAPVIVYQAPARPSVNPKSYVVGQPCPFCGSEFKAVIEKGNRDRAVFTACTHGVYVESQKERA